MVIPRGLGAIVCIKFAEEGCNIAINYVANAAAAEALKEKLEKEYAVKCYVVQAVCLFSSCKMSRCNACGVEADGW